MFLFDETQIVFETFLEDVNNILTSGEVPNLFAKDEIGPVVDEVSEAYVCHHLPHELAPHDSVSPSSKSIQLSKKALLYILTFSSLPCSTGPVRSQSGWRW